MDAWKPNTGAGDQAFDRGDAAQRVVAWLHRKWCISWDLSIDIWTISRGFSMKDWGLNKEI